MASPAPLTDTSSRGVRTRKCRPPSDASRSTQSPGVSSVTSDVVSTTRGPRAWTAATASFTASSEVGRRPGEEVELEVVGGDDVGGRHRDLAHELLDARPDEHAAADVADHRVAAVDGVGVGGAHPPDGADDGVPDVGRAEVPRQDGVAAAEHAAVGDALHDLLDRLPVEDPAGPLAVAGVVGELHGVHRPDLDAEALEREDRRGVADVPVGDVGLDRENVHHGERRSHTPPVACGPEAGAATPCDASGDARLR